MRQYSLSHLYRGGSLLAALAVAAPVAAQTLPVDDDAMDGAEIVVMGSIVAAQGESISAKREAVNLVDVAAADAVGRFPDQNSAAALSRLPAIAVQRDQGQERYIQVRGAPNRWTSVSMDGIPLIGVDEGGDTRAFRFDAIPAVLLSELVVNKSLTPDIQADAIVSSIDLRTYSPMSRRGFHISGDAGYGWMEQGGGEQRQASLRASWANDVFGIVVGGSHYRRKQLTDNREVGLYDEPTSAADTTFGPTEFDIRQYQLERWSNSLFGAVEYSPTHGQRIFAKLIFTEFNDDEQRNQYELRLDRAASGMRNLESGDLVNVPLRGSFNYGEYRNRNTIASIGGEQEWDSGLSARVILNYTRTENSSYLPLVQASTSGLSSPSLTYDNSDPRFPIVTLYQTVPGASAGSFARGSRIDNFSQAILNPASAIAIAAVQQTVSDNYTVRGDISKKWDSLTLSGGFLYADRTIAGNNFTFANVAAVGALGGSVGLPFDVNDYVTDRPWKTQFPLGFTLNYVDNVRMRADIDKLLVALADAGRFDPANNVGVTDLYAQNERTLAGYARFQWENDTMMLTGGVRAERYSIDNGGSVIVGGVASPLTVRRRYTDFFPSLNARVNLTDDLILRISGQRGISRPAFGAIRVGASINDTASPGTIGGGNPMLEPEYTWGADASLEYYLPGRGILSVAGFHRWVDNVLYQSEQTVGSDLYNSGGVDRSRYLLSSTFNGENGRLYGVELNYQQQFSFLPSPLDGLGFQGNVTFLGGRFDTRMVDGAQQRGLAFQGLSDTLINASLYYEKYGLSVRASYQWRDDWLDTLGGMGSGEYRKGYDNVDISFRYALNDNLTLFADFANLTDAVYAAYEGTMARPTEVEQIGRRYLFGLRFNF
jgi:TonB-dependent receptor